MAFDVESYLEGRLARSRPSGSKEITAECPQCSVYGGFYANRTSGAYVCFKCGFRGRSIVGLISNLEGLSIEEARAYVFRNSVNLRRRGDIFTLGDRVRGLRLHAAEKGSDESGPVDEPLPDGVIPCFQAGRWKLPKYLKERKIKSATARAWGLGYCQRLKLVYPNEREPSGFREYRIRHRLFIPIECPAGRSWTARDMTGKGLPKYFNPPGADHARLLIGWNVARFSGELVICEGPLDAMKLWQHGFTVLALGGKVLHDVQMEQLATLPEDTAVTVMLDPEEVLAPMDVAGRLSLHFKDVKLARLPDGVDPGSSTLRQAHHACENAKKWKGARGSRTVAAVGKAKAAMKKRWGEKKSGAA